MGHKPFVQEKGPSYRPARFAVRLQEELSTMVQELKDPRLDDVGFITITSVTVAPDLRNAMVMFALMGEEQHCDQTEDALNDAAGYLRRELVQTLNAKVTPLLTFKYDKGFTNTLHVDSLLKKVTVPGESSEEE